MENGNGGVAKSNFQIPEPLREKRMPDMTEFRKRVVEIATKLFPGHEFIPDPQDTGVIRSGATLIGLTNLQANFQLDDDPDGNLPSMIEAHFGPLIRDETPSLEDLSFQEVRAQLLPQIMPESHAQLAPLPLISFPLGGGIRVGVVADFPQSYLFVRQVDLETWNVTAEQIWAIALANLAQSSDKIEFNIFGEAPDLFIVMSSGDGYTAARILDPGVQEFLAARLGENFRFGIPNRDFLICWTTDCTPSQHDQIRQNVARDYSQQPYPLSPSVFVRNSEGNFHEQPAAG